MFVWVVTAYSADCLTETLAFRDWPSDNTITSALYDLRPDQNWEEWDVLELELRP
jgi:hypothetical protein